MTTEGEGTLAGMQPKRVPLYRDATVVKWVTQVIALLLVLGALFFLVEEAGANLKAKSIPNDFDFLGINPGFNISEGIDKDPNTGGRALWVGMVNTLRLAMSGIVFATLLGLAIGIARLSDNWIVNRLASIYIETIRNIPILVQIFIIAVLLGSAGRLVGDTGPINGWFMVSSKGLAVPRIFPSDGFYQWLVVLAIGTLLARAVRKRRVAHQDLTGAISYPNLWFGAVLLLVAVVGWFVHPVFGFLNNLFNEIGDAWGSIPQSGAKLVLAAGAVTASLLWIRRFLNSKRSPAGLAKLTDDDMFRMIFAVIGGLLVAFVVTIGWPGLSSWIINSGQDFWHFLGDKFGDGRTGNPVDAMRPTIVGEGTLLNYGSQGLVMSPGFAAMFIGLTLYTASFVAEIVRGGILAVPKGQSEAAAAIGLNRAQALRHVILPQAVRVSLPPLGNQYLNITKNTSLGIAIGFADVVNVGGTVLNQSGKALPVIAIWMLFFLCCSLTISVVVNWFNVRTRIVER